MVAVTLYHAIAVVLCLLADDDVHRSAYVALSRLTVEKN